MELIHTHIHTSPLLKSIAPMVEALGYDVVHLEVLSGRENVIRIYIDHLAPTSSVGIEDCVKVTKALDEPLDQLPEVQNLFSGPYELEVSSPGIDRPLSRAKDFERFAGHEARIQVLRPLTAEELGNPDYQSKNPKQKNFLGIITGLTMKSDGKTDVPSVRLGIPDELPPKDGPKPKPGKPVKAPTIRDHVVIPLPLISKANLEPHYTARRTNP